jgi:hypothetical protein
MSTCTATDTLCRFSQIKKSSPLQTLNSNACIVLNNQVELHRTDLTRLICQKNDIIVIMNIK